MQYVPFAQDYPHLSARTRAQIGTGDVLGSAPAAVKLNKKKSKNG